MIGIKAPYILDIDVSRHTIEMTRIDGRNLRDIFDLLTDNERKIIDEKIGRYIAMMHTKLISHGDLTTSNIIYDGRDIYFIDPSMGEMNSKVEELGTDLHLLKESFLSAHPGHMDDFEMILESYLKHYPEGIVNVERMREIEGRRRYS